MEFNDMRVKKLLTHSSCILYIGFFKNNDEEHFYSLSNNGELKEWLLNPNGSVILLETCYLLRPGSEYLDYIGFPPTENSANGHNIIISSINVADNLLFCGYEDGLVLVWNQERRNVVDLNTIKSWKRSRTIVKQDKTLMEEMFGKGKDTSNEKGGVIMYNENDDDEENENDDNEENENNNNESKSLSEKSNEKNSKINNNKINNITSIYLNLNNIKNGVQ